MVEQLVSFEIAKLAKEKGFNERVQNAFVTDFLKTKDENTASVIKELGCSKEHDINIGGDMYESVITYSTYINNIYQPHILSRPSQSLLQKWLRDIHNIHIEIVYKDDETLFGYRMIRLNVEYEAIDKLSKTFSSTGWNYEEALENALEIVLKRI